jgi:hypothetical protein
MRRNLRSPRFRRALTACLALAATLVAAGTPLLHAAAHAGHEAEHAVELSSGGELHDASDHGHDEVHPPALHDECVLQRIQQDPVMPAHPVAAAVLAAAEPEQVIGTRPIHQLPSRAPPPGDPARAPPLA